MVSHCPGTCDGYRYQWQSGSWRVPRLEWRDITWLVVLVKFDCTVIQLLYLHVQDALHYLILLLSLIGLRPDGLQVISKTDLELWLLFVLLFFLIDHYWLLYFSLIPILASCLEVRRDIIAPCFLPEVATRITLRNILQNMQKLSYNKICKENLSFQHLKWQLQFVSWKILQQGMASRISIAASWLALWSRRCCQ